MDELNTGWDSGLLGWHPHKTDTRMDCRQKGRTKTEKILYTEIAEAIGRFVNFQEDLRADHDTINYIEVTAKHLAKFPCYEYACTKPVVLNQLLEANAIKGFYTATGNWYNGFLEGKKIDAPPLVLLKCLHGLAIGWAYLIKSNKLNKGYLLKVGDEGVEKFVEACTDMPKYLSI